MSNVGKESSSEASSSSGSEDSLPISSSDDAEECVFSFPPPPPSLKSLAGPPPSSIAASTLECGVASRFGVRPVRSLLPVAAIGVSGGIGRGVSVSCSSSTAETPSRTDFGASIKAGLEQRKRDREVIAMAKRQQRREEEKQNPKLVRKDREVGVFFTAAYCDATRQRLGGSSAPPFSSFATDRMRSPPVDEDRGEGGNYREWSGKRGLGSGVVGGGSGKFEEDPEEANPLDAFIQSLESIAPRNCSSSVKLTPPATSRTVTLLPRQGTGESNGTAESEMAGIEGREEESSSSGRTESAAPAEFLPVRGTSTSSLLNEGKKGEDHSLVDSPLRTTLVTPLSQSEGTKMNGEGELLGKTNPTPPTFSFALQEMESLMIERASKKLLSLEKLLPFIQRSTKRIRYCF